MNNHLKSVELPADPREVVRASCIRVGSMPEVPTKTIVWVLMDVGMWQKAKLKRRLPGGVYWAELVTYPFNGQGTTVSANTFGGVV